MTNKDNFDNRPDDDDDDSLDWLNDDSLFDDAASSAKKSDATGFTGELPWMQDNDEEVAGGDDDDLSWLSDDEPAPAASGIGADLDWGGANFESDDDELSWLADDDEETTSKEWQSPNPQLVDTEFERQMDAAEAADFGDTDSDLDWLVESADINTPPTGGLELPDWMSGMDVPEVSEDELAAAHASVAGSDDEEDDLSWMGSSTADDEEDDLGWLGAGEEEEEAPSFASLLGGTDDEDDAGIDFAFASSDDDDSDFAFASSSTDDDEDLSFLGSSSSDDDEDINIFGSSSSDDDEEFMPTASGKSGSSTDALWGDLGSGFTQETEAIPDDEDEQQPVNAGWGIDFEDDQEAEPDFLADPGMEELEAEMDDAFAAMFPEDDEEAEPVSSWTTEEPEIDEPDWMQQIEASAADDDLLGALETGDDSAGELDDLLAQFDTGTDSGDVDDLLASLDVVGDANVDMDDLLAELEGVDTGDDLDDLLAQDGETEEYDDAVDPLTFHTGITDMFDNADDDSLDFLAETESEVDAEYDEYDDMPLAFDSGVTEMFDVVNSEELDFLLNIEAEAGDEDYDDVVDPLAFSSGITDLLNKPSAEELDLLAQMEEELAADEEYDDSVEPLAFDAGLTDLMDSINTQDLQALSEIDSQLTEEEDYDDAVEPLAFDTGLTDLIGSMNTGDLEALDSQLKADDDLDFSFLDDLDKPEPAVQSQPDDIDFSFLDDFEQDEVPPEPVAQVESDELNFNFDFEDTEPEPAAQVQSDELDFSFDFEDDGETAAEPAEQVVEEPDFGFDFGEEVEEETPKPIGKRDSGLLKRTTDDLSDLGFGEDVDWLAALDEAIEGEEAIPETPKATAREPELNMEDLLGSLDSLEKLDDYQVEEDEDYVPIRTDLDDIFDEYDLESLEDEDEIFDDDDLPEAGEIPEWLRDAASGKGEKYEATKVIRGMQDRSLDELDERLLDLHERGLELSSDETDTESDRQRLVKVVPNIGEALVPAKVMLATEAAVLNTEPRVSPDQLKRAELLRSIVGEATGTDTAARPAPRRRISLPLGRWFLVLLLAAAVITPFFISDFNISDAPASTFNGNLNPGSGLWAYQTINNLQHEDLVLFAVEYGATGARELDTLTEALLTHILHQGARPVIVSSDAIGALRAERIAAQLAGAEGYNTEYYAIGFLPGDSLGLRDLNENLNLVVADNTNGQPTGLNLNSLNDFKTIVLVAEGGETVRDWMEQVVPETTTPIIVAIGQSARPVAQSYVDAYLGQQVVSLLIGYPDAVTYQSMLIDEYGYAGMPSATPAPTETAIPPTDTPEPTATATRRPTNTPEPEETTEAGIVPPLESTEEADEEDEPTSEVATEEEPTEAPTREAATESEPSEEPSPTAEAVEAEEMVEVALIKATGMVNVREGPGAGFNVIGTVQPEQRVRIIGRNDAGDWLQIVLPDGTEAWIASFLTEIELVPESEAENLYNWGKVRYLRQPPRYSQQGEVATQTPTETPEPLVNVGRNASGTPIDMFDDADLEGTPIEDLSANTEFVILAQTDTATQIMLIDGRMGWVESRFVRSEEVPLSESGFEATSTPTPTPTSTPTLTPTSTNTPTPTATPFTPDVFPQQLTDVEARWNATTFGLLATILLIFVGNVYWIIRWLRRRGEE